MKIDLDKDFILSVFEIELYNNLFPDTLNGFYYFVNENGRVFRVSANEEPTDISLLIDQNTLNLLISWNKIKDILRKTI